MFIQENALDRCKDCGTMMLFGFQAIEGSVQEIMSGKIESGMHDLSYSIKQIPPALDMCADAIHIELPAVSKYAGVIVNPESFAKFVTEAWISPVPRGQIKTDWSMMKRLWASKDYFGTGEYAATVVDIVFGNVPHPPLDFIQ